uniref:Dol-P-Glc:Glc(2)Man(9)GlcNAc(2)-PP-Dol alpha-1,2-glucosyltransferase n=1 Tax=Eptatretus burgeri TaxID=7764 RepID=A0A8C4Q4F2_EPTBU
MLSDEFPPSCSQIATCPDCGINWTFKIRSQDVQAAAATTTLRMSTTVREPYMDEIFHVPQAQRFCAGTFQEWDPMITTLPGLYLYSAALLRSLGLLLGLPGKEACTVTLLRLTNITFTLGNLTLLYQLVGWLHAGKGISRHHRLLSAATLSLFPVLYFFNFFYYTDPGAVFFSLGTYLSSVKGRHGTAAVFGVVSILFRQTNVIWVAFCGMLIVSGHVEQAWGEDEDKKEQVKKGRLRQMSKGWDVAKFFSRFLSSPHRLNGLLSQVWPYATVGILFLIFIILNGGIVVGDRQSHVACLHLPQFIYFLVFTLVFSIPMYLSPARVWRCASTARSHPLLTLILIMASFCSLLFFSYTHPYLLADNRHYTFYAWRRLLGRRGPAILVLVPGSLAAGVVLNDQLHEHSPLWRISFLVCVLIATVPQRLLEFRYFIMPYLLFRVHAQPPPISRLLVECLLYLTINLLTFHLFLNRPFHWIGHPGHQRFMW